MKSYAVRLLKGMDLKNEMQKLVQEKQIKAGVVLSGVGCLEKAQIRDASGVTVKQINKNVEIVSLMGTLSLDGCHIHISVSDENLATYGGHLKDGCIVNTTVELVIGELDNLEFKREMDEKTGYKELVILDK